MFEMDQPILESAVILPVKTNEKQDENQNEVVFQGDEIVNLQFKKAPMLKPIHPIDLEASESGFR